MAAVIASLVTCSGWFAIAQRHKIVKPLLALEDISEEEDEEEDTLNSSLASFGSLDRASKLRRLSSDEMSANVALGERKELKAIEFPEQDKDGEDPIEDMLDKFEERFEEEEQRAKRREIRQKPQIAQALGVNILRPEALQFNPNRILQDPGKPAPEPEAVSVLSEAAAADEGLAVVPVPKKTYEELQGKEGSPSPKRRRLRSKQAASAFDQIVPAKDHEEAKDQDNHKEEAMDQDNHEEEAKPVKKRGRKRKNPANPDDPEQIVEKQVDMRGQNKRGDSISIAKKLEACKRYEALVDEFGKKEGSRKFYELKLPGPMFHCMPFLLSDEINVHMYKQQIKHTYIHTYKHMYIHTNKQTNIHTYIHKYILRKEAVENHEWRIQSKIVRFESFSNRNLTKKKAPWKTKNWEFSQKM